jgi:hypothetical protein
VNSLEVALEKIMLTVVGLCFASMICVPLILDGVSQISDQRAYSQFQDLVSSIDSGINAIANGTHQGDFSEDIYVPTGVTMNSSFNEVSYNFNSTSISRSVSKEYPIPVSLSFNYPEGWYRVGFYLQNSTEVVVSFNFIGS